MKRSPLKRQGKKGRENTKANAQIDRMFREYEITTCEARLPGCWINEGLTRAHRKKRREYYREPEKLSDFNEVILCCLACHDKMEISKGLTKKVFERCRQATKFPSTNEMLKG